MLVRRKTRTVEAVQITDDKGAFPKWLADAIKNEEAGVYGMAPVGEVSYKDVVGWWAVNESTSDFDVSIMPPDRFSEQYEEVR